MFLEGWGGFLVGCYSHYFSLDSAIFYFLVQLFVVAAVSLCFVHIGVAGVYPFCQIVLSTYYWPHSIAKRGKYTGSRLQRVRL